MKQLKRDDVLEVYLNSLAHVYDPHSDYMGHQQMETFSMHMNLKLFGIGAVLRSEDGYTKIQELVPGGPAARSGLLKPGDRIIAVAQGSKEPVDIVNMPISHAVEMIRGPKGSTVTLTILPAGAAEGAAPKKVVLVRDEIKLEEQESKARILDWPAEKGKTLRLAVIDLPSFYADLGGRDGSGGRSATTDVNRLLTKLKAERVEGIALDLRRNGGGSLEEAIKLTGLFIRSGPVVQTRGPEGDIELGNDTDPTRSVRRPPRGVDQSLQRLGLGDPGRRRAGLRPRRRRRRSGDLREGHRADPHAPRPPDGPERPHLQLRSRRAQDHHPQVLPARPARRPSCAGVASDIVLPSPTDTSDVSEASLTNPLAWDSVPAARYQPVNLVQPYLAALKEASARRVAADKEFEFLREQIALIKKGVAEKSVSLNEAERRKELAEAKAQRRAPPGAGQAAPE